MIPTAFEYMEQNMEDNDRDAIESALIDFAQIHVEAALMVAYTNSKIRCRNWQTEEVTETEGFDGEYHEIGISKESILTAYPATNIK